MPFKSSSIRKLWRLKEGRIRLKSVIIILLKTASVHIITGKTYKEVRKCDPKKMQTR